MEEYNPKNERIKRDYFRHQREACNKSDKTVTNIRMAINRFEEHTKYKNFSTFNKEQAIAFKKHFLNQKSIRSGEQISKATVLSTVNCIKDFFRWLSCMPGFKSKILVSDIDYFNLTDKEISIAKAVKFKNFPTLEQIRKALFAAPTDTQIQRRNRALFATAIASGMRDDALASLRLKHIDTSKSPILIRQEPDLVRTKFSKQIITYLFPVGEDIIEIIAKWVGELREEMLYGNNDPIFPRTLLGHDKNKSFVAQGLEPICWTTGAQIRVIFRQVFENAGLPYFKPHLFRDTLVHLGQEICSTPEEFKAWSQNLGHENVLTTFTSYGNLDPYRQGEVMKSIAENKNEPDKLDQILAALNSAKNII